LRRVSSYVGENLRLILC